MTNYEHVDTFAGKQVKDWDAELGILNPDRILYRIASFYDDNEQWTDKFADFLHDPAIDQVTGIVVVNGQPT